MTVNPSWRRCRLLNGYDVPVDSAELCSSVCKTEGWSELVESGSKVTSLGSAGFSFSLNRQLCPDCSAEAVSGRQSAAKLIWFSFFDPFCFSSNDPDCWSVDSLAVVPGVSSWLLRASPTVAWPCVSAFLSGWECISQNWHVLQQSGQILQNYEAY